MNGRPVRPDHTGGQMEPRRMDPGSLRVVAQPGAEGPGVAGTSRNGRGQSGRLPPVAASARGLSPDRLNRLRRVSVVLAADVLDEIMLAPEIVDTPHGPVLVAALTPDLVRLIRDGLPDLADVEDDGEDDDA